MVVLAKSPVLHKTLIIFLSCKFSDQQVVLACVFLLSSATLGQENKKEYDIKKLINLYKSAKKRGFDFCKVNFDKVCSCHNIS